MCPMANAQHTNLAPGHDLRAAPPGLLRELRGCGAMVD